MINIYDLELKVEMIKEEIVRLKRCQEKIKKVKEYNALQDLIFQYKYAYTLIETAIWILNGHKND